MVKKTVENIFSSLKIIIQEINDFTIYFIDFMFCICSRMSSSSQIQRLKYRRDNEKQTVAILANGPSLRETLRVNQDNPEWLKTDFIVMNYFANEEIFTKIKPRFYCLADPMFYNKDYRYDKVMSLFGKLNQIVDWKMELIIVNGNKKFLNYSGIHNPNIKIHSIINATYNSDNRLAHFLYRHGLAVPLLGTVAILCGLVAINRGYKTIKYYGVDMTFFEGICVNSKNELCTIIRHFYDDTNELEPYVDTDTGKAMKLSKYIDMVNRMVYGHERLSSYARTLNVRILNCTRSSMLDCYDRAE